MEGFIGLFSITFILQTSNRAKYLNLKYMQNGKKYEGIIKIVASLSFQRKLNGHLSHQWHLFSASGLVEQLIARTATHIALVPRIENSAPFARSLRALLTNPCDQCAFNFLFFL